MRLNLNNADRVNYNGTDANEVKFNGDVVWGDYETAESEQGKCLRLDGCLKRKPRKLIIYGGGISVTPNFETPSEISFPSSTKITVCGKNLFDVSKFKSTGSLTTEQYIKNNGDGSLTVGNGNSRYNTSHIKLSTCCPNMVAGEKYTLTAKSNHTDQSQKFLYLPAAEWIQWFFGKTRTVTQQMLDSHTAFYSDPRDENGNFPPANIWDIQIEAGNTPTAYNLYKNARNTTVPYELMGIKDSDGNITARDRIEVDFEKGTVKIIKCVFKTVEADNGGYYLNQNESKGDFFCFRSKNIFPEAKLSGSISNILPEYSEENADSEYFKSQRIGYYSSQTHLRTTHSEPYIKLLKSRFTNSEFSSDEASEILKDLVILTPYEDGCESVTDITDTECGQALLNLYCNSPCSTVMSDSDIKIIFKKEKT